MLTKFKSPLHETVSRTATDYWNDSCAINELNYAIEHGAVGATTNPVIVREVLNQEWDRWEKPLAKVILDNPEWSEIEVARKIFEAVAIAGAKLLEPIFEREKGLKGRLSIQTDPRLYRNWQAMTEQAVWFSQLAPNMQVKLPVTKAGIKAIEETTYLGINVNATVCFTVPQSLAVAQAVERALHRRQAEGLPVDKMTPVCTIMVGRTDDWIHVLAERDDVVANPSYLRWAGVAVFKKAYNLFQERGYRTRLLAAAYRHHLHWSEFIGGDVILTIPYKWQLRFNNSDVEVKERISMPVPQEILEELCTQFPDFRKAYEEDGLLPEEFDTYGATVRTLRAFITGFYGLVGDIRDQMLPNPDVKK